MHSLKRVLAVLAVLLPLVSRTALAAPSAADPDPQSAPPRVDHEFFDRWLGGVPDAAHYRAMWDAARATPAEPAPGRVSTNAVNTWQLAGPLYSVNAGGGNMTGRVRDIDAHNARVLAASGGLWRFNFGPIAMSDSVPATWYGSFACNPSNADIVLLGTGEFGIGGGNGLYRTTDAGGHWALSTMSPPPTNFTRVRYAPGGAVVHAASDVGYFRSTDDGVTWSRTLVGQATDLSTVNGDPNLLYVMLSGQGLWRSTNAGAGWSQVTSGGIPTSGTGFGAVSAMRALPSSPVTICVAFNSSVWRSTDSGTSWSNVTPSYTISVSGYGPCVSVCPTDPNLVLMGNVAYNRSSDGGATWTKIATPHLHADNHVFAWDDDGVGVWCGHDGGWSHSTDKGLTWDTSSNVMPVSQFYSIDCEKNDVGYMIGGTQDNNVLYTPNQALFWTDPAVGSTEGDATGACIDLYAPTHLWAISGVAGPPYAYPHYRSTDGGTVWSGANSGIAPNNFAGSIRTDNAFPVMLVTSVGNLVYQSTDAGVSWAATNTAFPTNIVNLTSSTRVAGGAVLYATVSSSTPGQRLYVRDNGSWVERSAGLPAGIVYKVEPHPWAAYADEAWAIVRNGTTYSLFRTNDRGVSWTGITGDYPTNVPIADVVVNPYDTNQLFVGGYVGCYRSRNGGANWERWTNGIPPTAQVTEMTYNDLTSSGGGFFVVAATYGRSVWKRDISGDDPLPALTIADASIAEGDAGTATLEFTVSLSYPGSLPVRVDWSTADGSAVAGDYEPASGTLTIPAGQTQGVIAVTIDGDTQLEADETFTVQLSNPSHAVLANTAATGTIFDDDAHVLVRSAGAITDGTVYALAVSGSTLYVGGQFSHVGPATGAAVPLDAASGAAAWLPLVNGTVAAAVSDGAGGWYLGGTFDHVGGYSRSNLAHLRADHTLDPWYPRVNGAIDALALSGATLIAGGSFTAVGTAARGHLAAFDVTSGALTTWNPGTDDAVAALLTNGTTIYVGGSFTKIAAQPRLHLAEITLASGLATAWNPSCDGAVFCLARAGSRLYAGGAFASAGGQPRHDLAALAVTTGLATAWAPEPDQPVYALAVSGATVYAGGGFATIDGQARAALAALDTTAGHASTWAPNPDGQVLALAINGGAVVAGGEFANVQGQPRGNLAAIDAASGAPTAWDPEPNGAVLALASGAGAVLAGGSYTTLGAVTRHSAAALDLTTGRVTSWDPNANGAVYALTVSHGAVYLGGAFTTVAGVARNHLASLDTLGTLTTWDPNANSIVRALLPIGSTIVAGGQFTTVGAVTRNRIAALATSGVATSWNPNASGTVYALATDSVSVVYAGGAFGTIGGQSRSGLAALNGTTGAATTWNPTPNGAVYTLAAYGGALFAGGDFTSIAGQARARGALLSTTALAAWNPGAGATITSLLPFSASTVYVGGAFATLGGGTCRGLGQERYTTSSLGDFYPDPDGAVFALASYGGMIWVGGAFRSIGGLPMTHLAALIPTSSVDVAGEAFPGAAFALGVAPNPTRGALRIRYTLPRAARVRLGIYDLAGRRVAPEWNAWESAGAHERAWEGGRGGTRVQPGVYFVRLESDGHTATRRFVRME